MEKVVTALNGSIIHFIITILIVRILQEHFCQMIYMTP